MVAETEILCSKSVSIQYFNAKRSTKIETEFFNVSSEAVAVSPTCITTTSPKSQIFCASDVEISIEICCSELVVPVASMLTPNQFEAEQLTTLRITSKQDGREACNILHAAGPSKGICSQQMSCISSTITWL